MPRHPVRSAAILKVLNEQGLKVALRSKGQVPDATIDIYLADTLGELGLFYALASVAFIGGSLVPVGGHNLIEAAQLDCAIVHGHHMHKTLQLAREFAEANAAIVVESWQELATQIATLLTQTDRQNDLTQAAKDIVSRHAGVTDTVLKQVAKVMPKDTAYAKSA